MIKESNVSLCVSDLSANYERQEEGLRQSLMSWAALTVPWSHWSTGNARGLKHELLPSITLTQLDILAITVVGNSKNYQIVPKMCVIVEQSKTDVRSISVFSRSCSLAAWPFMSKAWISTERATVWGRLWCHFAVHCVTKKKKALHLKYLLCFQLMTERRMQHLTQHHMHQLAEVCVCEHAIVWQRLVRKMQQWSKGWTFIKTETRAFCFPASGLSDLSDLLHTQPSVLSVN